MAGKVRIRLVMADGTQARGLEDLREHFNLESVLGYYQDGKLVKWLRSLYIEEIADEVESLDEKASDFQQRLCDVLGVAYTGNEADLEAIQRRKERLDRLRQFTDAPDTIAHIDQVAFDQEELADLLDEGVETIYLCSGKFTVPAAVEHVRYIGIDQPDVHIDGKITVPAEEFMRRLSGCTVDNPPQYCVTETSHDKPAQTQTSEPGEYMTPEDLRKWGGIEALPGKWNTDCYGFGSGMMYGFVVYFTCLVDKDKKIKEVYAIWIPNLPEMTITDLTEEEIDSIKNRNNLADITGVIRAVDLAKATEMAHDDFKRWYDRLVSRGMLKRPNFNWPKVWGKPYGVAR